MNKLTTSFCFTVILTFFASYGWAGTVKDQRLLPISVEEVKSAARKLPLSAYQHRTIISRADSSGLEKTAYDEYVRLRKQHPDSFHANLLCGVASKIYLDWATNPGTRKGKSYSRNEVKLVAGLQNTSRECLEKALATDPSSGIAHTEYGFFLFYRGNKQEEGMRLLVKGVGLAPNDPRTHRLLGDVLSLPGTKFYTPDKAQKELKKAIQLDLSYASPHWRLATLYTYLRRFEEASKELSAYVRLIPESSANSESVISLRAELQKHVKPL